MNEDKDRIQSAEPDTVIQHPVAPEPVAANQAAMELPEIPAAPPMGPVLPPSLQHYQNGDEQQPRKRSGWKLFVAAAALLAIGAGVGSATTWTLSSAYRNQTPIGYTASPLTPAGNTQRISNPIGATTISDVYRNSVQSVATITVTSGSGPRQSGGAGTGFVVDPAGYILTNYHVIDGGNKIVVKFVDGSSFNAEVVGSDKYKDLALVKINPGNRPLVALPLGNSDDVVVGETAIAIGSPFQQDFSVTAGIISALNRAIPDEWGSAFAVTDAIQTDAAINPGNSGGPLLNARGEVIGINTAIEGPVRGNVGIGFAVPINRAKELLPTLKAGQQVQYPYLGVSLDSLTPELAKELDVNVTEGAVIGEVMPGTPAAEAGLKSATVVARTQQLVSADIVVEVDGQAVKTDEDLRKYIASKRVGDKINMVVLRGSERVTLTATLAPYPEQ